MLTPDVEHELVGAPQMSYGREAAAAHHTYVFANLVLDRVTLIQRLYGDDRCVDEPLAEAQAIGSAFELDRRAVLCASGSSTSSSSATV